MVKKEAGCHPKMNGVVAVGDMLFNNPEKMQRRNWILTVGDVMGIFTAVLIATAAATAGNPSLLNNYRPISLLPVISKVIEKILSNQLRSYFESNKLFYENQYGFRSDHSTEYATL